MLPNSLRLAILAHLDSGKWTPQVNSDSVTRHVRQWCDDNHHSYPSVFNELRDRTNTNGESFFKWEAVATLSQMRDIFE